jgi:glycolate oxidase FAD binding subunit
MAAVDPVAAFAADVGDVSAGPIVAVGGRTQWGVGGEVDGAAREVRAPAGVVAHEPADMTVRVRAGTAVDDLDAALAERGQCVALPGGDGRTVGGVLAVGHSGLRRLGYGPVRDTVLEVRWVSADGTVVKGGGPTVKNVSGYDLCRLFVGSLGTLGLLAETVLRTRPLPAVSQWFTTDGDPFHLGAALYRPVSLLWDGTTTWVLLEGHPDDIAATQRAHGLREAGGPPPRPPHRWSMQPGDLAHLSAGEDGSFLAEIGVGIVHRTAPAPAPVPSPVLADLHRRVKEAFDPYGRLAPGRRPLAA